MTYKDFVNKYLGRYVEYSDPRYMYQCQDLMRKYIEEVWRIPQSAIPPALYAKDVFTNFQSYPGLVKVKNTPTNVPQQGDLLFMGWWYPITGIAGHVGIVDSSDIYKFVLFNQNYPIGSPCNFRSFKYRYPYMPWYLSIVRGWIHKI